MDKIIGVTELQRKFRTVLDKVVNEGTAYILTRGSRPEVVMIPYEQYQKFVQMDEAEVLARFDKLRRRMVEVNARYSEEEVEKDVRDAKATVRSRKH
ncbi:MAG TPA: type II toxin-antitoxin system Phd/YefM family antitoxin [Vicinamibacteria bacterium]|jgi:prevent-host-death family protein